MKKTVRIVLPVWTLLMISVLIASCSASDSKFVEVDGFPQSADVNTIEIEDVLLDCPERFVFVNGKLVTSTNCTDKLIQVINPGSKTTRKLIAKGNGPSEFSRLYFSGHAQGDSLYFRNLALKSAWVHPHRLLEDDAHALLSIDEPGFLSDSENVFQFDSMWVYTGLKGDAFMSFARNDGQVIKSIEHFPETGYKVDGSTKGYLFYSNTTYNENKEIFVSALRFFPYLMLTDIHGNVVRIIKTRKDFAVPQIVQGEIMPDINSMYYYDQVLSSERFIYALRLNATLQELGELKAAPVLEVFDWSGNAVGEIHFDRFIGGIAIDYDNGILYAGSFCLESLTPVLVKCQLPGEFI